MLLLGKGGSGGGDRLPERMKRMEGGGGGAFSREKLLRDPPYADASVWCGRATLPSGFPAACQHPHAPPFSETALSAAAASDASRG